MLPLTIEYSTVLTHAAVWIDTMMMEITISFVSHASIHALLAWGQQLHVLAAILQPSEHLAVEIVIVFNIFMII